MYVEDIEKYLPIFFAGGDDEDTIKRQDEALTAMRAIRDAAMTSGDSETIAECNLRCAMACLSTDRYGEALDYARAAKEYFIKADITEVLEDVESMILHCLIGIHFSDIENALEDTSRIDIDDYLGEANSYFNMVNVPGMDDAWWADFKTTIVASNLKGKAHGLDNPDTALNYLDCAYNIYARSDDYKSMLACRMEEFMACRKAIFAAKISGKDGGELASLYTARMESIYSDLTYLKGVIEEQDK